MSQLAILLSHSLKLNNFSSWFEKNMFTIAWVHDSCWFSTAHIILIDQIWTKSGSKLRLIPNDLMYNKMSKMGLVGRVCPFLFSETLPTYLQEANWKIYVKYILCIQKIWLQQKHQQHHEKINAHTYTPSIRDIV